MKTFSLAKNVNYFIFHFINEWKALGFFFWQHLVFAHSPSIWVPFAHSVLHSVVSLSHFYLSVYLSSISYWRCLLSLRASLLLCFVRRFYSNYEARENQRERKSEKFSCRSVSMTFIQVINISLKVNSQLSNERTNRIESFQLRVRHRIDGKFSLLKIRFWTECRKRKRFYWCRSIWLKANKVNFFLSETEISVCCQRFHFLVESFAILSRRTTAILFFLKYWVRFKRTRKNDFWRWNFLRVEQLTPLRTNDKISIDSTNEQITAGRCRRDSSRWFWSTKRQKTFRPRQITAGCSKTKQRKTTNAFSQTCSYRQLENWLMLFHCSSLLLILDG